MAGWGQGSRVLRDLRAEGPSKAPEPCMREGPGDGVALGSVLRVAGLLPGKITRGNKMGVQQGEGSLWG